MATAALKSRKLPARTVKLAAKPAPPASRSNPGPVAKGSPPLTRAAPRASSAGYPQPRTPPAPPPPARPATPPLSATPSLPPAPAVPPQPPSSRADPLAAARHMADAIDRLVFPGDAAEALGLDRDTHRYGLRLFLAEASAAGADPGDPVERMLHEHLVLVHHRAAALHAKAAGAKSDEAEAVLNAAAARLTAEFTRVVDSLAGYRQGEAARGRYAGPKPGRQTGK